MPKSARKRKNKTADFSKAKLKLGKGKQLPHNVIDTSYKCRAIALPTQNVFQENNGSVPTTKRSLTFEDLITRVKHYNSSIRRDSILGLRELLEAHWEILEYSLPPLINACARMIEDEDASVRKTLIKFLAWLLPRIRSEDILPHLQTVLLFTTHAQSHLLPEIRLDAVLFLDIILEHYPDAVISGWDEDNQKNGARVLEGYLGTLGVGSLNKVDGPSRVSISTHVSIRPASKLVLLQSLSTLLNSCVTSTASEKESSTSSFMRCFRSDDFYLRLIPRTNPQQTWREDVDLDYVVGPVRPIINCSMTPQWMPKNVAEVTKAVLEVNIQEGAHIRRLIYLANMLHPILLATFLDCADEVFSPSPPPPELQSQLILNVFRILRSLHAPTLEHRSEPLLRASQASLQGLADILRHVASYFPFELHTNGNINLQSTFQDMNVIICELASLHMAASLNTEQNVKSRRKASRDVASRPENPEVISSSRIIDVILQFLHPEPLASTQLGKPLSQADYISIFASISALLHNPVAGQGDLVNLLIAVIDHSIKLSCRSTVKLTSVAMIAQLVNLDGESLHQRQLDRDVKLNQKLEEWVAHLPRALWEFDIKDLQASEYILRLLLYLLQRRLKLTFDMKLKTFRALFIPYFQICHPTRGLTFGPFRQLPERSPVRRLALDVVLNLIEDNQEDFGLMEAVDFALADTSELQYWLNLRNYSNFMPLSMISQI